MAVTHGNIRGLGGRLVVLDGVDHLIEQIVHFDILVVAISTWDGGGVGHAQHWEGLLLLQKLFVCANVQ